MIRLIITSCVMCSWKSSLHGILHCAMIRLIVVHRYGQTGRNMQQSAHATLNDANNARTSNADHLIILHCIFFICGLPLSHTNYRLSPSIAQGGAGPAVSAHAILNDANNARRSLMMPTTALSRTPPLLPGWVRIGGPLHPGQGPVAVPELAMQCPWEALHLHSGILPAGVHPCLPTPAHCIVPVCP